MNGSLLSLNVPGLTWPCGFKSYLLLMCNAVGMFGLFITSMGNITGITTSTPTMLALSIKCPRYHLLWYLLKSNLPQSKEAKQNCVHACALSLRLGVELPALITEKDESPASAKLTGVLKGMWWVCGFLKELLMHKGGWVAQPHRDAKHARHTHDK
ncbi:hypothetical protein AcV5_009449 [Taiwanofungus camphoratus]|nr:hypothetical protein AcV5_009449 [Antrodia cinnamomea]